MGHMKPISILFILFFGVPSLCIASPDKYIIQYAKCLAALGASKMGSDKAYREETDQVLARINSGMAKYIASESKGSRRLSDNLFNLAAAQLNSEYDFYDQVITVGGNKALISEVRDGIQKNCKTLPK
jgi:hypothetical protein